MKKMNKLEKKVAIAKDVLKWLELGKFHAWSGNYFLPGDTLPSVDYEPSDMELEGPAFQQWLKDIKECSVCARGAIFAAAVMRFDGVPSKSFVFDDGSSLRSDEDRWFTHSELLTIEHLFEVWDGGDGFITWPKHIDTPDIGYIPEKVRMQLIMKDIIEAGGRVRPASIIKRYEEWLKET